MIGVVRPDSGNITSLCDTLDRLGLSWRLLDRPELEGISRLILPGQGRFGAVMAYLERNGWVEPLRQWALAGKPLLGICVGMQVLMEASEEDPGVAGLGLLPGTIRRLQAFKRPMMGWAQVAWLDGSMPSGAAYFVNGYVLTHHAQALARTQNEGSFCSAVGHGNLVGVQFHPEKSGTWGRLLMARLLDGAGGRSEVDSQHYRHAVQGGLAKRVIPCLDVDKGRVVKGVNFKNLRDMGDPVDLGARYEREGADELVFLDISASAESRPTALAMVRNVSQAISIPFTLGGGLRCMDDIYRFLEAGADKVALNTTAVTDPDLIDRAAKQFGSQCIVVAIDIKHSAPDRVEVFTHGGRKSTGLEAVAWAREVAARGAGEILLTSMDRDGTGLGFDHETTAALAKLLPIPVIASGGAKTPDHLREALQAGADAVLAATMFHSGAYQVAQTKRYLSEKGINVAL